MFKFVDLLANLGFIDIDEQFKKEQFNTDLELYASIYTANINAMKETFDENFILDMLLLYTDVFTYDDFCDKLNRIQNCFNTDMWSSLIQYEWNNYGESSVFELMDCLKTAYFENHLVEVCKKVRNRWIEDYGEGEL